METRIGIVGRPGMLQQAEQQLVLRRPATLGSRSSDAVLTY